MAQGECQTENTKLRPVPLAFKQEVEDKIKRQFDDGILREVENPEWVSPIVVVKKSNGKIRVCGDFRELNKNSSMEVSCPSRFSQRSWLIENRTLQ